MDEPSDNRSIADSRIAWLCVAAVLTFAYQPVADSIFELTWPKHAAPFVVKIESGKTILIKRENPSDVFDWIGPDNWRYGCELVMGLVLAVPTWYASGLRIGTIREHWLGVSLICGLPLALTLIVYPLLPAQPFAGAPSGLWLLSPPAQDMVYSGFLYGRFERLFPNFLSDRIRIRWAVIVTAMFFSAWHIRNFENMEPSYVWFQLLYTLVGAIWIGMSRQWTGSMLYGMFAHMAGNYIASRPVDWISGFAPGA